MTPADPPRYRIRVQRITVGEDKEAERARWCRALNRRLRGEPMSDKDTPSTASDPRPWSLTA